MLNYEFPPIGGGGGLVTRYFGEHFTKAGHEVYLLTSRYGDLAAVEKINGINVIRVPVLRKRSDVCAVHEMATYVLSAVSKARHLLKKQKFDIVQAFFGIPSAPVAYFILKKFHIPYVVFLGGRDVPRRRVDPQILRFWYVLFKPAIRAIWRNAAAVIACSNGLRDLARLTDPQVDIQVIADGVDVSHFQPVERQNRTPPIRLLMIGRLIPRKNINLLFEALPKVQAKYSFRVQIVGDGPERKALEQKVEKGKLAFLVDFVGSVPYGKLIDYYNEADVFVHCSEAEGMPLVVLEAMACGLPIVGTKVQGIEDLIEHGQNGYLFEPGDTDILAKYLSHIIDMKDLRASMGKQSLHMVQSYDWSHIAQRYLDLYQNILRA
jgi:glycosyltransferase involved in cell wall biosynthesis